MADVPVSGGVSCKNWIVPTVVWTFNAMEFEVIPVPLREVVLNRATCGLAAK
jgi:hypothetical protein